MSKFPQSSIFEFYCDINRMDLTEYRKERAGAMPDEDALNRLAGYYDEIAYDAVNQIFIVEKDGKLNFVDESDMKPTPPLYDFCRLYPGFAVVRKGNQVGNLFFHEGLPEPASYRTVDIFEVKRGNYYGVETASGDMLLKCTYRFVKIYPGLILAQSDEGYLLFHTDGRRMFDDCFDEVDVSEMCLWDYIFVRKNDQWGVVHVCGHWIIPDIFRNKSDIINEHEWWWPGLFNCSLNGKRGLYDEQGKLIVPFEYDKIEICNEMYGPFPVKVTKDEKSGLVDRRGILVFPCVCDQITCISRLHFRIRQEGTDCIWRIPHAAYSHRSDGTDFTEPCMPMDSSCCDFFKTAWSLKNIGDHYYYTEDWMGNQRTEDVDEKEAIRWFLMCVVCGTYQCDTYFFQYMSEKFSDPSVKRNNELLSLFEFERIRKDRKVEKVNFDDSVNELSSAYTLAGVYFEGKTVRVNYSHAFELYNYCLDVIQRRYAPEFNTKFDVLTGILVQGSENINEGAMLVPDDDYQKCVLIAYRIGWMLHTGNGVEKDEEAGMELLSASQVDVNPYLGIPDENDDSPPF